MEDKFEPQLNQRVVMYDLLQIYKKSKNGATQEEVEKELLQLIGYIKYSGLDEEDQKHIEAFAAGHISDQAIVYELFRDEHFATDELYYENKK